MDYYILETAVEHKGWEGLLYKVGQVDRAAFQYKLRESKDELSITLLMSSHKV